MTNDTDPSYLWSKDDESIFATVYQDYRRRRRSTGCSFVGRPKPETPASLVLTSLITWLLIINDKRH